MPTSPYEILRNDPDAALQVLREYAALGPVPVAVKRTLARLQDDPSKFFEAAKSVEHTVAY